MNMSNPIIRNVWGLAILIAALTFGVDALFAQSEVNDDFLKKLRIARDEMEQNFQKGQTALQAGDYQVAKEFFEKVIVKNRNYRNVQAKLRQIEILIEQDAYLNRYASKYSQALQLEERGQPEQALEVYREIAQSNAAYKDIQQRIAACEKAILSQKATRLRMAKPAAGTARTRRLPASDARETELPAQLDSPAKRLATNQRDPQNVQKKAALEPKENETEIPVPPPVQSTDIASKLENALAVEQTILEQETAEGRIEQASDMRKVRREQFADQTPHPRIVKIDEDGGMTPIDETPVVDGEKRSEPAVVVESNEPGSVVESPLLPPENGMPLAQQDVPDDDDSSNILLYLTPLFLLPLAALLYSVPAVRARYFLVSGQFARAAECYEMLMQRNPGKIKIYQRLATVYMIEGRKDSQAIAIYKTAIQTTDQPGIREQLRQVLTEHYLEVNELDSDAIKLLEAAVKSEKSSKKGNAFMRK